MSLSLHAHVFTFHTSSFRYIIFSSFSGFIWRQMTRSVIASSVVCRNYLASKHMNK